MLFSGHRPRKSLGQHWLNDQSVLDEIINSAAITYGDSLLEIGPGKGVLTKRLLNTHAEHIHAVEIDKYLIPGLLRKFSVNRNFSLTEGDILSVPLDIKDAPLVNKVVANIPYNITSPLLERLLGRLAKPVDRTFNSLVLLMQREVADRIIAKPGNSSYGALSVRTQLLAKCSEVCIVAPSCFTPSPRVFSKVIHLKPYLKNERFPQDIESKIDILLKVAFMSRRKKLRNTLVNICSLNLLEDIATDIGITLDLRPQDLSITKWVDLAQNIKFNDPSIRI